MFFRTLACAVLSVGLCAAATAEKIDTVLLNGKVLSADERGTVHQALAIAGDRIVALGKSGDIKRLAGKGTRVVDLGGRTVIPGLIDSHMHAIRAALSYGTEVHWFGTTSIEQALGRLRDAASAAPPGQWLIVAGGWTDEQFKERRRPTQAELVAAAPNNPVYVQWMYGWAMLTPLAYQALNINSEADLPGGGKFVRDASGNPTGAVGGGIVQLFDKLPAPGFDQKVASTRKFFRELNRVGLTGVVDPGGFNMTPAEYAPLFQVWRDKALTVRVNYAYFSQKRGQELEEFKELTQLLPMGFGDELLRFNGIGERVTFRMYNNDQPSDADKEQYYQALKWAAERGLTVTQHWHSNASIHHLLDVYERVNREIPIAPLRWSVAHLNDGTEATFARMKKLGVGWALQDAMYYDGERELKIRGEAALKSMPPMRTALKAGVMVGAGTDAHRVANYSPFIALRWMLDGKSAGGVALRGPEETPNRQEALRMYTSGSAWLAHDEARRGTLAVGKLADLAVLSKDYLSVPVDEIGNIHSLLTLVGGRVVYAEGPYAALEARRP
ncbi:MAG: amidohydrolase [Burkholderiales bacterium]|nr:amidohydrolase [Burkholderiales bacterium]